MTSQHPKPTTNKGLSLKGQELSELIAKTIANQHTEIELFARMISNCLASSNGVFWCGNGGSAAESQHLSAELSGRFKKERKPLKSFSLNSDTAALTCISNDYSYASVFARQVEGLCSKGDMLVALSTSGDSPSILEALKAGNQLGMLTFALLGNKGGRAKEAATHSIIVESSCTARIQEVHLFIGHYACEIVDNEF